jgi:crossover junction endodeoxyribonuclease RuvC
MPAPAEHITLGVDPGSGTTGWGVVCRAAAGGLRHVAHGVIRLGGKEMEHPAKLAEVYSEITLVIQRYCPDALAIEAPFQGKNIQSMLKLGRVQGVVMAAAMAHDIPVAEYAPTRVKKAVVGRGAASKEQVAAMLPRLLPGLAPQVPFELPDASDALAIALCHCFALQSAVAGTTKGSRHGGWEAFVAANANRVVRR